MTVDEGIDGKRGPGPLPPAGSGPVGERPAGPDRLHRAESGPVPSGCRWPIPTVTGRHRATSPRWRRDDARSPVTRIPVPEQQKKPLPKKRLPDRIRLCWSVLFRRERLPDCLGGGYECVLATRRGDTGDGDSHGRTIRPGTRLIGVGAPLLVPLCGGHAAHAYQCSALSARRCIISFAPWTAGHRVLAALSPQALPTGCRRRMPAAGRPEPERLPTDSMWSDGQYR